MMLSCTGLGGTSVECFSSEGAGVSESSWLPAEAPQHAVEGYTSETSFAPGDTFALHVSTSPAQPYRVEIYRLGWYDGDGGRLVAQLPANSNESLIGVEQPIPAPDPVTFEIRADWSATDSFIVPEDWESGYYVANLILTAGPDTGKAQSIPFVVRAEASRNADIVVEVPVNTWQAYNRWGGHSLYDPDPADKVSFDRPYDKSARSLIRYEIPLARFLEREGFDVEYVTNVDVHRDPSSLLDHNLVISTGHDEYWSGEMRTGFDTARDSGTNLVFASSNTAYWQVRYENAEQTLVGYKVSPETIGEDPEPDPSKKSMKFRDLTPARPEHELLGVQYLGGHSPDFNLDESTFSDYTIVESALGDAWFDGTGIVAGDVFENRVGYEWDQVVEGNTLGLTSLFEYAGAPLRADAVKYTAPSGSTVFSTGSMGFSYALDNWRPFGAPTSPADPRLQTFMRNVISDLGAGAVTGDESVVEILAAGYTGEEQMQLLVDGEVVATWDNVGGDRRARQFVTFTYTHPSPLELRDLRVVFANDGNTATGADRNLMVDAIVLDGVRYESEAPTTYSTGTWSSSNGCGPGNKQSEVLHCGGGGYFQYDTSVGGTVTVDLAASSDSGDSSTDKITNDNTPTLIGVAPVGSTVEVVSSLVGSLGTTLAASDGTWSLTSGVVLSDGVHELTSTADGSSVSLPQSVTIDTLGPTVSIEQSVTQADPTTSSLIAFDVLFSESTTTFSSGDVSIAGSAGATTAVVSGNGVSYTASVSGMTSSGTVIASVSAGVASDIAGNPSLASTSQDNVVDYELSTADSVVEILAAGYTGEEQMQLLVDGEVVATWDNVGGDRRARQFVTFTYTHPSPLELRDLRVVFANDGNTATGADRNLMVDAIVLDGVRYESEAPTTYSTGTWSSSNGCGPGNKQSEVLHCGGGGYFQYDTSVQPAAQNQALPQDVNGDGSVSPMDAILVINQLSEIAVGNGEEVLLLTPFDHLDVNADGIVSAQDALQVINFMTRQLRSDSIGQMNVQPGVFHLEVQSDVDDQDEEEDLLNLLADDLSGMQQSFSERNL
ncbi:Dockerin type I repeat protein [Novipirellula artificiosorum]|uniref:Dockerin type I repeat protein n=2 Tax=Novipirellula artificiosorum TaxID=2528016 RepID=A0A5C6DCH8_9BACT|nr:Dockerin type I repeat protein [Novipirellula artificiosorum]